MMMNQSDLQTLANATTDLAHTAILFYLIYSVRIYLTARLDRVGAEPIVIERRAEEAQS